jgi:hypothetical protein
MPFGRVTAPASPAPWPSARCSGENERRDGVGARTKVVLDGDRDREVLDTYQTGMAAIDVTITAAPVQRVSDIRDDVLKQTSETAQKASAENETGKQAGKGKKEQKLESEFVKVDQLPPDAQCRKVTTELETKAAKKAAKEATANKSSNTSILCQTSGGEWKPAST